MTTVALQAPELGRVRFAWLHNTIDTLMPRTRESVASKRKYAVRSVQAAKEIATVWLTQLELEQAIVFGLPEIDDRHHVWRVPLRERFGKSKIGEIVIDARTTEILSDKSTRKEILEARILGRDEGAVKVTRKKPSPYSLSTVRNTIALGDCVPLIDEMPAHSIDLVFTSPPYFNARPEYSEYEEYEAYLMKMRQVIRRVHRVLGDGRFFVMNTAPVLIRRASRNESSRRIAVPFDMHRIFVEEGYDFIDDIIWLKPEGAGWATGRGRRFAADRNPLQYKAVPVTEYVMVYRKRSDLLIDWHIRNHPDPSLVSASRIADGYEKTNVWKIQPRTNSKHPAAFPIELAQKVINYYSFKGDVVLDPFAGSGTVGQAAVSRGRRFVLCEINLEYVEMMRAGVQEWMGKEADNVLWINTPPLAPVQQLL